MYVFIWQKQVLSFGKSPSVTFLRNKRKANVTRAVVLRRRVGREGAREVQEFVLEPGRPCTVQRIIFFSKTPNVFQTKG